MQLVIISSRQILRTDDGKEYDITQFIEEEIERRKLFDNSLLSSFSPQITKQRNELILVKLRYETMKKYLEELLKTSEKTSNSWFRDGNVLGYMIELRQQIQIINKWLENIDI